VSRPDVGVVIAAGGRGVRFGGGEPKQFRSVAGVPILLRAIRPFARHPRVAQIVVVLPHEHVVAPPEWLGELTSERLVLAEGGATRADSVQAGLRALHAAASIVLVHDAARPFVSMETIDAVIDAVDGDTAVVPGVPVADTLKRVDGDERRVVETVDRSALWRAHTPQGFPRPALERAFGSVSSEERAACTDEAALVEAIGVPVRMVVDRSGNVKITTEEDLGLAEFLAQL
jgi:2-C-methyl-D-erythritol 4-phosphate cytidylyltransferase